MLDDNPAVREAACRCAQGGTAVIEALMDLLTDLHATMTEAAALTLERLGLREGAIVLTRLLATTPTQAVVHAQAAIADENDWMRLGQAAMRAPDVAPVVVNVLDESEEPRAIAVAAGVRRRLRL